MPQIKPIAAQTILTIEDVVQMTKMPVSEIEAALLNGRLGFEVIDRNIVMRAFDVFDWAVRNDAAARTFINSPLKIYDIVQSAHIDVTFTPEQLAAALNVSPAAEAAKAKEIQ